MSKNIFFISLLAVSIFAGCSKKDNIFRQGSTDISVSPMIALDSMHFKLDSSYTYQTCDSIPTLTSVWKDTGSIKITVVTDNVFNITDSSNYGVQSYTYTATKAVYMKSLSPDISSTYIILFQPDNTITYSTANPINQLGAARGYFTMSKLYPYTNTATSTPFIEGFRSAYATHDIFYKIK